MQFAGRRGRAGRRRTSAREGPGRPAARAPQVENRRPGSPTAGPAARAPQVGGPPRQPNRGTCGTRASGGSSRPGGPPRDLRHARLRLRTWSLNSPRDHGRNLWRGTTDAARRVAAHQGTANTTRARQATAAAGGHIRYCARYDSPAVTVAYMSTWSSPRSACRASAAGSRRASTWMSRSWSRRATAGAFRAATPSGGACTRPVARRRAGAQRLRLGAAQVGGRAP